MLAALVFLCRTPRSDPGLASRHFPGHQYQAGIDLGVSQGLALTWERPTADETGRFWVEWEGSLDVPRSATYRFRVAGQGPGFLYLDGRRVITEGEDHGQIELSKGPHEIRAGTVQSTPSGTFAIEWARGEDKEFEPIDTDRLSHQPRHQEWRRSPRQAAQVGVEWLQSSSVEWQRRHNCFGCHVQGQVSMGLAVAELNRYQVNADYADELSQGIEQHQNENGTFHSAHHVTATQFAAMGLAWTRKVRPTRETAALVAATDWLLTRMRADGAVPIDHNEPPIDQGTISTTANSQVAFNSLYEQTGDERYREAAERAFGWLETALPETTQDTVFQLIAFSNSASMALKPRIDALVQRLRGEQQADGGWMETRQMGGPNAYATGQVLYAFKQAGVSVNDPAFRAGVVFLLNRQRLDGSWPATNTQTHRPSEFAPTMWAVIGLAGSFGSIVPRLAEVGTCGEVKGTVTLSATVDNYTDSAVKRVSFAVGSEQLRAKRSGEAWSADWDSSASPPGRHTLRVTATNRQGSTGEDLSALYTGPPFQVNLQAPPDGTEVRGMARCSARLENPAQVPIERVDFYVGELLLASAQDSPWEVDCDFSNQVGGPVQLRAVAVGCGQQSEDSAPVVVVPLSGHLEVRLSGVTEQVVYLSPRAIEIVLDMSGSMWGVIEDRRKYEIARDVLSEVIRKLPPEASVGMRVYGHRREGDCLDTQLVAPVQRVDPQQLVTRLERLRPTGKTPIDHSLRQALEDLRGLEGTKAVILVSDGVETCGGDPVAAARALTQAGLDLKVHVVGFDVADAPEAVEQLRQAAAAGGGRFFVAESADQLSHALEEAVQLSYAVRDQADEVIATLPVGSPPLEIMSGTYSIEINSDPVLKLDGLVIEPGGTTLVELAREDGALVRVPGT